MDLAKQTDAEKIEGLLINSELEVNNLLPINRFQDGVYLREVYMPARYLEDGQLDLDNPNIVLGHEHKTDHWNIVLSGRALVNINGIETELKAGDVFFSEKGIRKALIILEDMRFITTHKNEKNIKDNKELEDMIAVKSPQFLETRTEGRINNYKEELCQ